MDYVTFDSHGNLTGSFCQKLQPEHKAAYIEVSEEQRLSWLSFRANDARNGLEKLPPLSIAPEPVVDSIPMLNLQLVLIDDGKLAAAETIIEAMPGTDGQRARAYWARAQTARLDNEVVGILWPQLYSDEDAFKDAWRRAAALNP